MVQSSASFVLLLSFASVFVTLGQEIFIGPPSNRLRILNGYTDCGSLSEIVQVQLYNCPQTPCDFKMGQAYNIVAYFKPLMFHTAFDITITLQSDITKNKYILRHNKTLQVEPGMVTTFSYRLNIKGELGEGMANLQVNVAQDMVTELCFSLPGFIHK